MEEFEPGIPDEAAIFKKETQRVKNSGNVLEMPAG